MSQSEELRLALHSMVMADALLAGSSGLSYAASWLSKGWIWAFQPGKGFSPVNQLPPNATMFRWNDQGVVEIVNIQPPRWPRQALGSPPGATKASASRNNLNFRCDDSHTTWHGSGLAMICLSKLG